VVDLLAGVDAAVAKGIADPARLGIGGWSYGGISTNYTIATDPRFKAAVSGAGSSLQHTMYGTEQMYQALRTEGVETQLVVYPGQNHALTVPSYRRDRLQRYLDWFGKHLGGGTK
jgi:dipeptidyl aminopeptidase/acylaminoacyl peptidase